MAAGAELHFGFEVPGVPFADFARVLAVLGFAVAGEVVLVDAVEEGKGRQVRSAKCEVRGSKCEVEGARECRSG